VHAPILDRVSNRLPSVPSVLHAHGLALTLRVSAVFLLVYFTASHWFFPTFFFRALGIEAREVASHFVLSQLRLIGAMVAGYAIILVIVAGDLARYLPVLWTVIAVGAMCTAVFVGQVAAGTLPVGFLVNAGALVLQMLAVIGLGWRGRPRGAHRQ